MNKLRQITHKEMAFTSLLMAFVTFCFYGIILLDGELLFLLMAFVGTLFLLLFYLMLFLGFIVSLGRYWGIIKTDLFDNWY